MDLNTIHQIFESKITAYTLVAIILPLLGSFKIRKIKITSNILAKIGIAIALSAVISVFSIKTPLGGSITIGSMVPIFIVGLAFGPEIGILAGFLYGFVYFAVSPYFIHPIQFLLDYPIGCMMFGLAGFFKNNQYVLNKEMKIKSLVSKFLFCLVPLSGRFICNYISGLIFFKDYAKELNISLSKYVFTFLASFSIPELIISLVIISLLPLKRLISIVTQPKD